MEDTLKVILLVILSCCCAGCVRHITYDSRPVFNDGVVCGTSVRVTYFGPVGNTDTKDLKITLGSEPSLSVRSASVNMDRTLEALEKIIPGITQDLATFLKLMMARAEAAQ